MAPLTGIKVLLVDNDDLAREAVQDLLELNGAEVLGAENGRSGIELACTASPDVIVCDYMMPDLDGLRVLEAIRRDPATAAIGFVAITVSTNADIRDRFMRGGADAFLVKIDDVTLLIETMLAVLRKRSNGASSA